MSVIRQNRHIPAQSSSQKYKFRTIHGYLRRRKFLFLAMLGMVAPIIGGWWLANSGLMD